MCLWYRDVATSSNCSTTTSITTSDSFICSDSIGSSLDGANGSACITPEIAKTPLGRDVISVGTARRVSGIDVSPMSASFMNERQENATGGSDLNDIARLHFRFPLLFCSIADTRDIRAAEAASHEQALLPTTANLCFNVALM